MDQKVAQLITDLVRAKPGISVGEVAVHLYRSLDREAHGFAWMITEAVNEGLIKRGEGNDEDKLFPADTNAQDV